MGKSFRSGAGVRLKENYQEESKGRGMGRSPLFSEGREKKGRGQKSMGKSLFAKMSLYSQKKV